MSKASVKLPIKRSTTGTRQTRLPRRTAKLPQLPPEQGSRWTFLTNHSHVLILLTQDPYMVLRTVAARISITERAVQRIIADLEEGGVIEREKVGRQNHYRILPNKPLRHSIEKHRTIGDLLSLICAND